VTILDHRNPDAKIQTLELALGASDRYREIFGRPGFEQTMGNFARPGVEQDFGQRDHARLTEVRRVIAVEVALNLVEEYAASS